MPKLNARKILAGLQAEVDEARERLVAAVMDTKSEDLTPEIHQAREVYAERYVRLTTALGQWRSKP